MNAIDVKSKLNHFLKYPGFIGPPVNRHVLTMVFRSSGECLHNAPIVRY